MTRRIQPPDCPTTGHPFVDNALRNAWREYRDFLNQHNVTTRSWGMLHVIRATTSTATPAYLPPWHPVFKGSHLPRKTKKAVAKKILAAAFLYNDPTYYTPRSVLL